MLTVLYKIFILPFIILSRLFEKLYIRIYLLYLKSKGFRIGKNYRFHGIPLIKPTRGSSITIGNNFMANSGEKTNIAGIIMPTILATTSNSASLIIGNNVMISGASIVAAKSIEIGDKVTIGTGVCIWDNDFHPVNASDRANNPNEKIKSKDIIIEDNVFIGARAIILKGVTIGKNSIIGAGAVVFSNVESDSVYSGNPAKFIKKIEDEKY